jgi:hypothetical protein
MSAKRIKLKKKKQHRTQVVGQWFEIEVVDGVTRTTAYPANEEVEKMIAKKEEETGRPVELVYRRLNFINGIPDEYAWTTSDPLRRKFGGMGIQRLRVEDWRQHILEEEPNGHLRRSDFQMPRPEDRGGCQCRLCRAMAERLEQEAIDRAA